EKNLQSIRNFSASGCGNAIDKSKKMLTAMSKRMTRNKWNIGSVIVTHSRHH
ncbi:unnamed protein product, partial [Brassica oleracea]